MLKKHDDLKQMLSAQEDKVTNLGKDPSLAQAKQIAAKKDKEAKEKVEKQRLDELKKKEKEKLLEGEGDTLTFDFCKIREGGLKVEVDE